MTSKIFKEIKLKLLNKIFYFDENYLISHLTNKNIDLLLYEYVIMYNLCIMYIF